MKLSISNIAWSAEYDDEMYHFLNELGYCGLEIAPTRIFPENPYKHNREAKSFAEMLRKIYNLDISSVQSLWYGRNENIFNSDDEREFLLDYTKKSVLFSEAAGCHNLVFGSPKNRNMPSSDSIQTAIDFFSEIGIFAANHNAVIAIEAIPQYYGTNLINTTQEAFDLCRQINCDGFKVNLDLGTLVYNDENIEVVTSNINLVNHVHISEPMLANIEKRELHKHLKNLDYDGYFSIEMKNLNDIELVKRVVRYIKDVFV
ncbi:MAG: sugar phosphate isomerase/epimerase family protein [Eubacteriales bacterium]